MTWQIVQADARALPLADASVDLLLTSPPYWGLRSYRDGGEHYDGQIGSETTPAQYVDELVSMIDSEWRRVLKPSGSMFLNLGDKYAGSGGHNNSAIGAPPERGPSSYPKGLEQARPKSLLGLPWRIAINLIDRGWILRAEIIWSKPNGMPESVTDRVRRSHEQVFHFTKEPRYYSAVDEIRERCTTATDDRGAFLDLYGRTPSQKRPDIRNAWQDDAPNRGHSQSGLAQNEDRFANALGRLPGSVWTIATSPLIVPDSHRQHWNLPDHFAPYPPELCRRIIVGWSPKKVCQRCGEGRRPVSEKKAHGEMLKRNRRHIPGYTDPAGEGQRDVRYEIVGEACACPTPDAPTRPGIILDPMAGTGTTVGVAHKLGRHGIGVDLSADYCRLAEWRVSASGHFDQIDQKTAQQAQGTFL